MLAQTYDYAAWHWSAARVRDPFDVPVGAVLVQHTTWRNAERALAHLRAAGALDGPTLASMPEATLVALVRVSGMPTIKARRVRALAALTVEAGGLDRFYARPAAELRALLLATHGIGPETADAIALYGAGHRVFQVDAYAQRLFRRLGLGPEGAAYAVWQRWFEQALPAEDASYFRRYHAYIVLHAKARCRAVPSCARCPLLAHCPEGQRRVASAAAAPRVSA
ncbi:MAG: endonuclease [Dehalococcoidia bacterium]|nr:endonuclease [Dehalococcoidia bacterium]